MKLDVSVSTKHRSWRSYNRLGVAIAALLLLLCFILLPLEPSIEENMIKTVEVKEGELNVTANVFGRYASQFERLVSAPSLGQINEINVRAGDDVKEDTVIAKLSNPDLEQEYFSEKSTLEQIKNEHDVAEFRRQSAALAFQAELADLESQLAVARMDVSVNKQLIDKGIAAKLDLEKALLTQELIIKKLDFAKFRYSKLIEMHKLEQKQSDILLSQQVQRTHLIKSKINELTIVAGMKGTIQRLDIELGQRVVQGEPLARIGSQSALIARLNIPQRIAEKVTIGNSLSIKHDNSQISGKITQLSSVVENGFIMAEAQLEGEIPANIRPAQPLTSELFIRFVPNALFVVQQPGFKPQSSNNIFVKDPEQKIVKKVQLTFGELSGNKLLVDSGAKAGDLLVTSDLSKWSKHSQLLLN